MVLYNQSVHANAKQIGCISLPRTTRADVVVAAETFRGSPIKQEEAESDQDFSIVSFVPDKESGNPLYFVFSLSLGVVFLPLPPEGETTQQPEVVRFLRLFYTHTTAVATALLLYIDIDRY